MTVDDIVPRLSKITCEPAQGPLRASGGSGGRGKVVSPIHSQHFVMANVVLGINWERCWIVIYDVEAFLVKSLSVLARLHKW